MRELQINKNEAQQRFDKYLKKYLKNASSGFIYKMLRKKNITLNGKKADGSEILQVNDRVVLFFSEETLGKFHEEHAQYQPCPGAPGEALPILYEDEDIILVNKPAGLLSQKAKPSDVSVNEIMIDYLVNNGKISIEELSTFKPAVCNRLDRNTSGIVSFGKTLSGVQMLSDGFRKRAFQKYYLCVVSGTVTAGASVDGFLIKDSRTNRVTIRNGSGPGEGERISTEYLPVSHNGRLTLLKVLLHTGKNHQIRAHLASMGHPLVGDFKYGNPKVNEEMRKKYGVETQMLHSWELVIPEKKLDIYAPIPDRMMQFLTGEHLWEHGKQEDLGALPWRI